MTILVKIADLSLSGKTVLLREDYNVPIENGEIQDDSRISASLSTINELLDAQAKIIIISHLGRPQEGQYNDAMSLAPVANRLSQLLGKEVPLIKNWLDGIDMANRDIVLCENVRFETGETSNDDGLARKMAALCNVYINDAFATAHRSQASTHSVAKYASISAAGPLLIKELKNLSKIFKQAQHPIVAIIGGAKISSKIGVLASLAKKVDCLIVGGGIANTLLKANGAGIGASLCEADMLEKTKEIISVAERYNVKMPLPTDVVCAKELKADAEAVIKNVSQIEADDMIADIGTKTISEYTGLLKQAGTILWNGPLGVFEFDRFNTGTRVIAETIAASDAFSVAGGGETLSALKKFGTCDKISYISTGGGAFLEFLEGKKLPAIAILEEAARVWAAMERAREY